jgi:eukaryotic-like serine/threonine-protein kinase
MVAALAQNPEDLIGMQVENDWTIIEAIQRAGTPGAEAFSGGFFSQGYIAQKGEKTAFLKVIDVGRALSMGGNVMDTMSAISQDFKFECSILEACRSARLDRIVEVIGQGEMNPPAHWLPFNIPYIMFERADGDLRREVKKMDSLSAAWILKILHNVAVGLQQLHGQKIAHQDLKPSNVLLFESSRNGAKIGDLGRASSTSLAANHDILEVPGAANYAPPEQVYGVRPTEWVDRKDACDLYQLGAIASFLFAGITPTMHYITSLDKNILPKIWNGNHTCDYNAALPMLQVAFAQFLAMVRVSLPNAIAEELTHLIFNACNPDYTKRGDPGARERVGRPVGIEAFASRFDRLSKMASIDAKT